MVGDRAHNVMKVTGDQNMEGLKGHCQRKILHSDFPWEAFGRLEQRCCTDLSFKGTILLPCQELD